MLVVTHELGFARHVSNRVVFMHRGRLTATVRQRRCLAAGVRALQAIYLQPPTAVTGRMKMIQWGDAPIRWQEVVCVARGEATLSLSDSAWSRIAQGRAIVQHIVKAGRSLWDQHRAGGALCNITLPEAQLHQLSRNTLFQPRLRVGPLLRSPQPGQLLRRGGTISATVNPGSRRDSAAAVGVFAAWRHPSGALPGVSWLFNAYGAHWPGPDGDWRCALARRPAAEVLSQLDLQPIAPGAKRGAESGQRYAVHDRSGLSGVRRRRALNELGRCNRRDEL